MKSHQRRKEGMVVQLPRMDSQVQTPHPTPYTLHPTPHTPHPTPYTLHPTPFTLHPTPYTLHPAHTCRKEGMVVQLPRMDSQVGFRGV